MKGCTTPLTTPDCDEQTLTADAWFALEAQRNPVRFAEVAERYPVNSDADEYRFRIGEPPARKRRRDGKLGGPARKRRYSDEEWEAVREARRLGLREWELDYAFAKELANS